jgi:hypothetical protein
VFSPSGNASRRHQTVTEMWGRRFWIRNLFIVKRPVSMAENTHDTSKLIEDIANQLDQIGRSPDSNGQTEILATLRQVHVRLAMMEEALNAKIAKRSYSFGYLSRAPMCDSLS